MVITELHSTEDILGHADTLVFGVDPQGNLWDKWIAKELAPNPAMKNRILKIARKIRGYEYAAAITQFKDDGGTLRVFAMFSTKNDGDYNQHQLRMLKNVLKYTSGTHRYHQDWDILGDVLGIAPQIPQEIPNNQPGGIFFSGTITPPVESTIKQVFGDTAYDVYIYVPIPDMGPKPKKEK